jgi:hypothetical protein
MGICCCLLDPQINSRQAEGSAWIVAKPSPTLFFACWRLPAGRKPSSVRIDGMRRSTPISASAEPALIDAL